MNCPKCGFDQPGGGAECIKCGIVFDKYLRHRRVPEDLPESGAQSAAGTVGPADEEDQGGMKALFLSVDPESGYLDLAGRAFVLVLISIWGLKLAFHSVASNYAGESFMHLVNLPFHEAGHILFRPFGQFMATLGGSLTQLLVPLVCLLTFLLKTRDPFGASVSLWWLGESLLDLAPYINDARDLNLILLGGVTGKDVDDFHDWEYLLRKTGLLSCDHFLAKTAHVSGAILMVCAMVWGGFLLVKQLRSRRTR